MAWGSGFVPWLKYASKSYKYYLDNTVTDMWVDYDLAYKEDKTIRSHIDSQIETMKNAEKWLYDNKYGTSFNITGEMFGVPNGDSENW